MKSHKTDDQAAHDYAQKQAKGLLSGRDGGVFITAKHCYEWSNTDFLAGAQHGRKAAIEELSAKLKEDFNFWLDGQPQMFANTTREQEEILYRHAWNEAQIPLIAKLEESELISAHWQEECAKRTAEMERLKSADDERTRSNVRYIQERESGKEKDERIKSLEADNQRLSNEAIQARGRANGIAKIAFEDADDVDLLRERINVLEAELIQLYGEFTSYSGHHEEMLAAERFPLATELSKRSEG